MPSREDYKITTASIRVGEAEIAELCEDDDMPQNNWNKKGSLAITPPGDETWYVVGASFTRTIETSGGAQVPFTFLRWQENDDIDSSLKDHHNSFAHYLGSGVGKETSGPIERIVKPGESRSIDIYAGSEDGNDATVITITDVTVRYVVWVFDPTDIDEPEVT
jgi:hypothetical protein